MPERLYRLSEAARLIPCSVDLLKYYETTGRMTFRRELGMRVLTMADVRSIRALRADRTAIGRTPKQVAARAELRNT